MSTLIINRKIGIRQMLMQKLIKEIETEYYAIVDEMEQKLGEKNIKTPNFTFKNLSLIDEWAHGKIGSGQALKKLDEMDDFDIIAYNKILKKLDKFYTSLPVNVEADIENIIRMTVCTLSEKVKPKYIKYLNYMLQLFENLTILDNKSIPIIYGFEQNDQFVWLEMSLDQAIRYTKSHNLKDGMYIWNDFMVVSGPEFSAKSAKPRQWFLFPNQNYVDIFKKVFSLNFYRFSRESKLQWFQLLEKRMFDEKV